MKQEKRVPKRRFRAFAETGEWNSVTLSDIADVVGGGTPDTENTDYWDGDIDWYTPSEIGAHAYADGSIRKISAAGLANSSAQMLPAGKTVLFTSRASIGDSAILQSEGTTNQGFQSLVTKDDVDPYFLYSLTGIIKNYALQQAAGSTFIEVSGKNLGQCPLVIPSPNEQQSIGEFCRQLDDIISLHECKLQKLEHLKQAYLAEMFPAKGERQPRRRFKGFRGDWNTSTLGELVSIQSGEAPSKFQPGKMPYIKVDDLNDSTRLQTTSKECVARNELISMIPANSVIFPKRGVSILTNKVRILAQDSYMDTNMMALIPQQIDYEFLYVFISKTGLYKIADTSTIPQINNKHIIPYEIIFPGNEEQHRIGRFFRAADQRIESEQRKLSKLRALKQAYLSELFV